MARIKRPSPPEHILVVDTNILWDKDKGNVVNPEFDQFWDQNSPTFPMKLMIPDVVKGELLFQQTTSALKLLQKANDSIGEISRITARQYSHQIREDRVTREIAQRFNQWLRVKGAEVWEVPIKEIEWAQVITNAVWRLLPFTPDPKNPENEKGFRDAMILETVALICRSYRQNVNIAFICNDFALRTAADERLGGIENLSTYESLENFQSFIDLTRQNLTDKFVKSILFRAWEKFYNKKGEWSLMNEGGVFQRLRQDFKDQIESPTTLALALSSHGPFRPDWIHIGDERIWIRRPVFKNVEGENIYHWTSEVTFVRLYERKDPISEITGGRERRLMVLVVAVNWKAQVRTNGQFYYCEETGHEESSYSFETATLEELREYQIEEMAEQTKTGEE